MDIVQVLNQISTFLMYLWCILNDYNAVAET
jgi:hypothetical protein